MFITAEEAATERMFPEAHAQYRFLSPLQFTSGELPEMSVMLVRIEAGKSDYDEMVVHDFVEFTPKGGNTGAFVDGSWACPIPMIRL
ncbi:MULTISPECIES: hypothetical protein [Paenibacillus]|uniref:Uncharacterized protein n=1 Tax=Paenibacillus campinasensis TaxID=66347 RepID=A0ABW9T3I4_9BACL|nr:MULTISPECIES: hypothetical protein [Paenibacillus]MUG67860.1 hypothetical protein [Paenibacillus campinasensis]